jgi:hypothetical protein
MNNHMAGGADMKTLCSLSRRAMAVPAFALLSPLAAHAAEAASGSDRMVQVVGQLLGYAVVALIVVVVVRKFFNKK